MLWLRTATLVALLLLTITACGAPGTTGTAPGAASSTTVASPSPSPPGALASPSPPDEAASAPPSAETPSTEATVKAAQAPTDLCVFVQSGGLAGRTETTTIAADGTVTVQRDRPASTSTGQASTEQIAALRALVEGSEWQQLDARYGRQVPDGFMYEVQCGGKRVTTYDGATNPAILNSVLEQIAALRRRAGQP